MACIACAVSYAPTARGQEAQADVLPLGQAVAMALGENRQVKSASLEVEKFSDRLAALRARQMAANSKVTKIESILRAGLSVVYLELDENLKETGEELDDIKLKLDAIHDLPEGAGPINFIKDFGDAAVSVDDAALLRAAETFVRERRPILPQSQEGIGWGG